MAERSIRTLLTGGTFFEGPRWHDGRWWVSDFYRHAVFTVTPEGTEEMVCEVAGQPSGLGWMPDGSLLVASMKDHKVLRGEEGCGLEVHADLSPYCGGTVNDMVVDSQGRAWVGDFGFDIMHGHAPATTSLKRVDPDGTVTIAAEDLYFPNGSVITPDGTLIVGETMGGRYTAFDVADDGSLTDRRVWAQLSPTPDLATEVQLGAGAVGPDGCALDADGHIWAADAFGTRCILVAAGGEILDEIPGPGGIGIYACMLGGDDGRTLLMCAAPDYFEHNRATHREAVLLTTEVEVPHAGLP